MINSIQSYQNTPKFTTNKAKTNNLPSFGSEFNLKIEHVAADLLRQTVKRKQSASYCGIVTAVNNWKKGITGILEKDTNKTSKVNAWLIDFKTDKSDLASAKVDFTVLHNGETMESSGPLTVLVKRTDKNGYVMEPRDLTNEAERMMRKIDSAKSDADALKELLPQAEQA